MNEKFSRKETVFAKHIPALRDSLGDYLDDPREPFDFRARRILDAVFGLAIADLSSAVDRDAKDTELDSMAANWAHLGRLVARAVEEQPGR